MFCHSRKETKALALVLAKRAEEPVSDWGRESSESDPLTMWVSSTAHRDVLKEAAKAVVGVCYAAPCRAVSYHARTECLLC